ncbi:MAG: hypothetical protein H0U87_03170 [Acidobacteria bacterium]|nr:hypothetical protein [Acidobacteriota bacterium]
MENNDAQKLAERIANFLYEGGKDSDDFASVRKSIEQINVRLSKIESNLMAQNQPPAIHRSPSFHPSQEKFEINEAVAREFIENSETEKPCPFEPTGKLCDHCSMCNSRGF